MRTLCLQTPDLGQFDDVPVSTESLDEQNAGVELPAPDIDVILFVAESSRLRRHNLNIGIYAPSVAVQKDTKGFFGRSGRTVLLFYS